MRSILNIRDWENIKIFFGKKSLLQNFLDKGQTGQGSELLILMHTYSEFLANPVKGRIRKGQTMYMAPIRATKQSCK
jgi:hypothetical protein